MSQKMKGLGRGLDALLGGGMQTASGEGELRQLAIDALRPGKYQPRTRMDDASLRELADSIRQRGVVQPILVRETAAGAFEIVAGERRWRAARIANLDRVPVLVREIADDAALGIGLIENIQRENLSAIEEAAGVQRLIDEFKMTHDEAARAIGRSRPAVSNLLRLLELSKPVQDMLLAGKLDMGHARALLPLAKSRQVELAHQIVHKALNVREAERLVKQALTPARAAVRGTALSGGDADVRRLETDLSDRLGTRVRVQVDKKGRGTLAIDFMNVAHLDDLMVRLKLK